MPKTTIPRKKGVPMHKNEKPHTTNTTKSIAYQNKDISSKYFAEQFKDILFKVYGLDLPAIVRAEPTELPAIEVSDMAMDNLYYLVDDSYAIIDYESEYSEDNKVKYLGYVARLFKRVYNQSKTIPKLRIVIIYTADVEEGTTVPELDMGDEKLKMTEAFLSSMNADDIIGSCKEKIDNEETLRDEERLKLMLCPLAVKGKEGKIGAIHHVVEIVDNIEDEKTRIQILTGMMAFCDKVIDEDDIERIRRAIKMTKWDRLIYNEKMDAINESKEEIAINLLQDGMSVDRVSRNTGLDIAVVEELVGKINANQNNKDTVLV